MRIKLLPPLDRLFGQEMEYPVSGPITVAEVLAGLKAKNADFSSLARFEPQDRLPWGLLIWRRGQMLTLKDLVEPEDDLEILVMVEGG